MRDAVLQARDRGFEDFSRPFAFGLRRHEFFGAAGGEAFDSPQFLLQGLELQLLFARFGELLGPFPSPWQFHSSDASFFARGDRFLFGGFGGARLLSCQAASFALEGAHEAGFLGQAREFLLEAVTRGFGLLKRVLEVLALVFPGRFALAQDFARFAFF
ncbi:MAG: hypothetical protein R3F17_15190 [Planctomycetota bacterium]